MSGRVLRRRCATTRIGRTRALAFACAVLAHAGCASFVAKDDYRDYRAVRLSGGGDAQLLAMQRYVAKHPDGHWADEVRAERARRERDVFEAGKSDRVGLELYLSAFPNGMYAEQARARLTAIAVIEQRKRDEAERAAQLATQRREREAELSRTWVTRFVAYWTKTFLGLQQWGSPIAEVAQGNPEFSRAFGRPPRPRCTERECVKYYESSFAVPVPGATRIEREMRLILRLSLSQSRLARAELLFPRRGFSRWKELESRTPVGDGDAQARASAVQFALARLQPMLDELAPGRQPLRGNFAREIPAPQIDPSGERVDTTVEDPSAPPNRIQGSSGPEPEPSIAGMVKPQPQEQEPDMVLAPVAVDPNGRARPAPEAPNAAEDAASGPGSETMEFAPVVVPRADGAAGSSQTSTVASAPPAVPPVERDPGATQAFAYKGLRIVLFAAPSDAAGPAYDGVVVEPSGPTTRH